MACKRLDDAQVEATPPTAYVSPQLLLSSSLVRSVVQGVVPEDIPCMLGRGDSVSRLVGTLLPYAIDLLYSCIALPNCAHPTLAGEERIPSTADEDTT